MADEYRLSYTGQQVDEAIGKALAGLPTITIALSQVVSQDPIQIQLTQAQCDILDANQQVNFDISAFGYQPLLVFKVYSSDYEINFDIVTGSSAIPDHVHAVEISVDKTTLIATYYDYGIEAYGVDGTTIQEDHNSTNYNKLSLTGKLPYLTTAPSADNTSGFLTIVVLSSEPATRYDGYLYIITGSN